MTSQEQTSSWSLLRRRPCPRGLGNDGVVQTRPAACSTASTGEDAAAADRPGRSSTYHPEHLTVDRFFNVKRLIAKEGGSSFVCSLADDVLERLS